MVKKSNDVVESNYLEAANHFTRFKELINPFYERARHIDLLDLVLMEVARYIETSGEAGIQRVIIEMPPRHSKSMTVSQMFPAWMLGRNPALHIILASYSSMLAEAHSRIARNYISEPEYANIFPDTKLSSDLAKVDEWGVVGSRGEKGGMVAVGLGGSITGKGADLLIIDDPTKNREEAESEVIRESIWQSYNNDFLTRFNDGNRAAQIVMATRWHSDDLIGRILQQQPKDWTVFRFPALAERKDILGRKEGEALWPARWNEKALREVEKKIGSYAFTSLYQQDPRPKTEAGFDVSKIKYTDTPLKAVGKTVRFYDLAITTKRRSDYTAGVRMCIDADENIFVSDVFRAKLNAPDLLDATASIAQMDGRECEIVLEGERSGITQLDYMASSPKFRGYTLKLQPIIGDKYTRATALMSRMAAGKVYLLKAPWNRDFVEELKLFPVGANDDQADAFSGAYNHLSVSEMPTIKPQSMGIELRYR